MSLSKITCGVSTTSDLISNVNGLIDSGIAYESAPDGFNWPNDLPAIKAAKVGGTYQCNIKPEDLIDLSALTNVLYVDISRPDSSGNGLTWATAHKGIGQAIDAAISSGLPTRIYVKNGTYPRNYSTCQVGSIKTATNKLAVLGVGGRVATGVFDALTWSKTGGYTNVYQATRSVAAMATNPSLVKSNGSYYTYAKVSSISICDSTKGSWYTDGTTVYVHSHKSDVVTDANARVYLNARGAEVHSAYDIMYSGIDFEGGSSGSFRIYGGENNTAVVDRVTAKYGIAGTFNAETPQDGGQILGCKFFAAFNSVFSDNTKDGLNIHKQGDVKPSSLAVGCKGFDNGVYVKTSQSNNGITAHDGCKLVDIGGEWLGSIGTNSGHVDDETQIWCFGVTAGDSIGDIPNGGSINYGAFGVWAGSAEMWLDNCTDIGSSIGILASGTANAYIRNHSGTGLRSGNISTY